MKKTIISLAVLCLLSTLSYSQLNKLQVTDSGGSSSSSTSIENTATTVLDIKGKEFLQKREYTINLGSEKLNVMFELSDFGFMKKKTSQFDGYEIEITGSDLGGNKTYPAIVCQGNSEMLKQPGTIQVTTKGNSDYFVFFKEPVSKIHIKANLQSNESSISPFLRIAEIYSLDIDYEFLENPELKILDCEKVNIAFLVDRSASIDKEEYKEIRENLLDALLYINYNKQKETVINIIEFDSKAAVEIKEEKLSDKSLGNDGSFYKYITQPYESGRKRKLLTNWTSALKTANKLSKESHLDAIIVLTDSYPNTKNVNSGCQVPVALQSAIKEITNLKKYGTHVLPIGVGDIDPEVEDFIFPLLTSGSIFNNKPPKLKFSFDEIGSMLSSLNKDCKEDDELNPKDYFKVFPNPTTGIINIYPIIESDSDLNSLTVTIQDQLGRVSIVTALEYYDGYTINISDQPPGVYIVTISDGSKLLQTSKVVYTK